MDQNNQNPQGGNDPVKKLEQDLQNLTQQSATVQPPIPEEQPIQPPSPVPEVPPVVSPPPVSPVTPIEPNSPMHETPKKGSPLLVIAIVLAVFAVLAVVAYVFGTKLLSPQPTPIPKPIAAITPSPTPDVTANWKTYTNTQYNFSFKYPEYVILEDKSVPGMAQVILAAEGFSETKVTASKSDLSDFYLDASPSGKATIGGISGNKYFLPQGYCDGPTCSPPILAASIINNGTKYVVSIFVGKEASNFTDLQNQILSTFKFIEVTPVGSPTASPSSTPKATP